MVVKFISNMGMVIVLLSASNVVAGGAYDGAWGGDAFVSAATALQCPPATVLMQVGDLKAVVNLTITPTAAVRHTVNGQAIVPPPIKVQFQVVVGADGTITNTDPQGTFSGKFVGSSFDGTLTTNTPACTRPLSLKRQ